MFVVSEKKNQTSKAFSHAVLRLRLMLIHVLQARPSPLLPSLQAPSPVARRSTRRYDTEAMRVSWVLAAVSVGLVSVSLWVPCHFSVIQQLDKQTSYSAINKIMLSF